MATSYYYTVDLQQHINGQFINVPHTSSTSSQSKDIPVTCVIRGYKNVDGVETHLTWGKADTSKDNFIADSNSVPSGVGFTYTSGGLHTEYNTKDGYTLYVEFKALTVPTTFTPSFTVTRLDHTTNADTPVPLKPGTKIQTISWTVAPTSQPSIPQVDSNGITTDLWTAIGGKTNIGNLRWDATASATGQWVLATEETKSGGGYNVYITTFDITGKLLLKTLQGSEPKKGGTVWKTAQKRLLKAVTDTGTSTNVTTINPAVVNPKNSTQFYNPPSHIYTRRPSIDEYINDPQVFGIIGATHKLGSIYQDSSTAANLNKKLKTGKTAVYGFNFTYNPTTISYTTTANTPIDWTLNASDPANILGGPTILSFDLYLNRIQDVAELKTGKYRPGNYARPLSQDEQNGLKYRGTEYDLEFLYRIVNGSPTSTGLISYKGETSDFGYITGTPFFLKIHENMTYYGGLAGLSVNHVMFSKDMVPILSVVSVTINRYPVFDSTGYVGKAQSKTTNTLKTTNTTPGG
jgi:hypothetical protein